MSSDAVDDLRSAFRTALSGATTEHAIKALHDTFLGRKSGSVTGLLKTLGSLPPDARKTVGDVFRCWLTFQKNAGAKRKRRRLHQHGPLPAACTGVGRGGGFFLRIVDKVLGLRRQRTNAQPHVFGKGGGTQALTGAQKKLIAISFAQLLQDAAHGRCRQSS